MPIPVTRLLWLLPDCTCDVIHYKDILCTLDFNQSNCIVLKKASVMELCCQGILALPRIQLFFIEGGLGMYEAVLVLFPRL